MHPVIFTRAARAELIDAQDWYENEAPGLGLRFRAAVDNAVQRISSHPRQFPIVYKTVRRALVKSFPLRPDVHHRTRRALVVLACFHGSRDPEHWQKRV